MSKINLSDAQIVEAAINGNILPLSNYFNNVKAMILYKIYSIVKNRVTAEDIVGLTYEKAVKNIAKYNGKCVLSTWLVKIAKNLAIDEYRKTPKNMVSAGIQEIPDTYAGEIKTNFFEATVLNNLIDELEETQRKMIKMRYYEDIDYNTISENLQIPLGTVKATLFRIKQKLKNKLVLRGITA